MSSWNRFVHRHAGKGYNMSELSQMYRASNGQVGGGSKSARRARGHAIGKQLCNKTPPDPTQRVYSPLTFDQACDDKRYAVKLHGKSMVMAAHQNPDVITLDDNFQCMNRAAFRAAYRAKFERKHRTKEDRELIEALGTCPVGVSEDDKYVFVWDEPVHLDQHLEQKISFSKRLDLGLTGEQLDDWVDRNVRAVIGTNPAYWGLLNPKSNKHPLAAYWKRIADGMSHEEASARSDHTVTATSGSKKAYVAPVKYVPPARRGVPSAPVTSTPVHRLQTQQVDLGAARFGNSRPPARRRQTQQVDLGAARFGSSRPAVAKALPWRY